MSLYCLNSVTILFCTPMAFVVPRRNSTLRLIKTVVFPYDCASYIHSFDEMVYRCMKKNKKAKVLNGATKL